MREHTTALGNVLIGGREEIFRRLAEEFATLAGKTGNPFTVGLTGGSTPKAFYEWAVKEKALDKVVRRRAVWAVSDERMVPLSEPESNFGNADRALLRPLAVPEARKFPWPVSVDPHSAGAVFEERWRERFGETRVFDLCLLGMGDDGHTASIFPGSPLLIVDSGHYFSPVEVPGKGWRLSITPDGLAACGRIVVMVTGQRKAERLREVLEGPTHAFPIQLLSDFSDKVLWLVDEDAASELSR